MAIIPHSNKSDECLGHLLKLQVVQGPIMGHVQDLRDLDQLLVREWRAVH